MKENKNSEINIYTPTYSNAKASLNSLIELCTDNYIDFKDIEPNDTNLSIKIKNYNVSELNINNVVKTIENLRKQVSRSKNELEKLNLRRSISKLEYVFK